MSLTETDIKALGKKPEREQWLNDRDGLYLRILPSGRKSWVWRSKKNGATSYVTIGEWPALTLKQARVELARRTGRGVPVNAMKVRDMLEEWYADQIEPNYRVTKNVRVYVNRAVAELGSRRLQELTAQEIARFVGRYGKDAPVAANRCLSTLKLALGWAVEVGYLHSNPALDLTRRVAGGREKSRARVLSDDELRAVWALGSPNANLLRALLLTGCRIQELQRAAVDHVDGDWLHIPAAHSKNDRAHQVFLVPETRQQFNGDPPLLFRSVSPTAVQSWVRRLQVDDEDHAREPWASIRPLDPKTREPMPPWTPHDLRRTFSTRMHGLGIAPYVVEKALNHVMEGVLAIYNQHDYFEERTEATKKWAAELIHIVRPGPVRRLRRIA